MKKLVCSAAALIAASCAGSVMAQSSVTVYGLIDTGVEYITNSNTAGNSVVKMPSLTGSYPSRLGFKGSEDLGGGLQAMFVLEAGFLVDTGGMNQGNRLFGRQSFVGLKNEQNTVMLGRQINMTYVASLKSDVIGPSIYSMGSLDAYLPNARSDNAIGYMGNYLDNTVTVGATYSFGRDTSTAGGPSATGCAGEVAGNAATCRQYTGLIGYDNKTYGVNVAYDKMNGGAGSYYSGGGVISATSSSSTDRRVGVHAYVMFGDIKLGGGLINRQTMTSTNTVSNLSYLGVSYPLSVALVADAQVLRLSFNGTSNTTNLGVLRLTYNLSKRTALYTILGHVTNSGKDAVSAEAGGSVNAGQAQSGIMTGIRHTF